MGYWITRFGTTDLPTRRQMQDAITGRAQGAVVRLPGGRVFDAYGTETAIGEGYQLKAGGAVQAATPAALKTAVYLLRALKGVQDKLYRTPDGGSANSEWVEARCDAVESTRDWRNRLWENVTLHFTVLDDVWSSGSVNQDPITLTSASPTANEAEINNGGNGIVRDIQISIISGDASPSMTQIDIENEEAGHVSHIRFSGTILTNKTLIIDCGALSVKNDGVDAWDDLDVESAHGIDEWLRLKPGNNTIKVTRVGGDADCDVLLEFYDGNM